MLSKPHSHLLAARLLSLLGLVRAISSEKQIPLSFFPRFRPTVKGSLACRPFRNDPADASMQLHGQEKVLILRLVPRCWASARRFHIGRGQIEAEWKKKVNRCITARALIERTPNTGWLEKKGYLLPAGPVLARIEPFFARLAVRFNCHATWTSAGVGK